jgi:hypothetical protein
MPITTEYIEKQADSVPLNWHFSVKLVPAAMDV